MKTAIRWVVLCVVGVAAAAPYAASASSPASNGAGDGEANVPFASAGGAGGMDGGSVAPGQPRGEGARAKVAGRAPGRRAYRTVLTDAAVQTEADRAFEQRVWTAP